MKKSFRKFATPVGLLVPCVALLMGVFGPNLRAATFSDDNWTGMGGSPGVQGTVKDTVVDAAGSLYIAGSFSIVGDVFATNLAKWDGTNWSALGTGIRANSYASGWFSLATSGTDLYAAGNFTNAGGIAANYIARWNGTNWSALGAGLNGPASALAVLGSDLYVGGDFATAGGIGVSRVARWNGSAWSALGSGMNNSVKALAVSGSEVYAGGDFTNAGGMVANRIAKWNGSSWSALGSGLNGTVTTLAARGSDLYVAGNFTTAGGIAATNIAKWNGSSWSAFPSPAYSVNAVILRYSVNDLTISGDDLYAAGDILIDLGGGGSISTFGTYVAKWNGSSWSALEPGIGWAYDPYGEPHVRALAVSGTNVYAGGAFRQAGDAAAHGIARWNGTRWSALAPTYRSLSAMTASGRDVYGAGIFAAADSKQSIAVAKWNGRDWSALGSEFQTDGYGPAIAALAVSGGGLYAGGIFTNAGGTPANRIARWNGTNWSALGSGLAMNNSSTPIVYALAVSGHDLYVGGEFTSAGGIAAANIAKWDGTNWSALGSGIGPWFYQRVTSLAVVGRNLYAGGYFTSAGGIPVNYVARWDGHSWSALGSGVSGFVDGLTVMGQDLYAVGRFNSVDKWDGTSWSKLPWMDADYWTRGGEHDRSPSLYALAVSGSNLYAGGYFTSAGEMDTKFIARWNGGQWTALGSGMEYGVRSLAATDTELFAGGDFWKAGGKLSFQLARARIGVEAQGVSASNSAASVRFSGVTGYPHDVQRTTSLSPPVMWTTVNSTPLYPAADGSFTFTDTNAASGAAYYRASAIGLGPVACPRIGLQQPAGTNLNNGDSVGFGAVAVGNSVTKTFTITNSGAGPLIIHSVSTWSVSADFVVNTTGMLTNVPAGGSTTFIVTFSPTSAGSHWEEVDVYPDITDCYDPNMEYFMIAVSGTGL